MLIKPIMSNTLTGGASATQPAGLEGAEGPSFLDELKSKIGEVNKLQNSADSAIKHSAAGGIDGIPETMIKLEEANMSLTLVAKVRDKALSAYQQVMQMQF